MDLLDVQVRIRAWRAVGALDVSRDIVDLFMLGLVVDHGSL